MILNSTMMSNWGDKSRGVSQYINYCAYFWMLSKMKKNELSIDQLEYWRHKVYFTTSLHHDYRLNQLFYHLIILCAFKISKNVKLLIDFLPFFVTQSARLNECSRLIPPTLHQNVYRDYVYLSPDRLRDICSGGKLTTGPLSDQKLPFSSATFAGRWVPL